MLELIFGSMRVKHGPITTGVRAEVRSYSTPTMLAAVRGTEFELAVTSDTLTSVTLFEGIVEVRANVEEKLKKQLTRWWTGTNVAQNRLREPENEVRTKENERTSIELKDGTVLLLDEGSAVKFERQKSGMICRLTRGRFFIRSPKNDNPRPQFLAGPTVAAIRGTEFEVAVSTDGPSLWTPVEGLIQLSGQQ